MDKNVCYRLKSERMSKEITQKAVAKATDVSEKTVARWENSIAIPSDKLTLLSDLGFDVVYVLTGTRTEKVEKNVLEKVTKATKTAQATGNEAGAKNLAESMDDMLASMVRRGENAKSRAEELRQITLMLTDMDDEQFEKAYQLISDIHSNKLQATSETSAQPQQSYSNNNNSIVGNTIGDITDSVIGNNASKTIIKSQGGWTDLQFIFASAICALTSMIFLYSGDHFIHTQPDYALNLAILTVIGYALTALFFMLGQTTANKVPSVHKKAPST